ncbi:MAG: glycine oxidase ThiO [Proteobacteria bacterium]|nr:glycine oxidase ThiO [Pseudomonadota bacterium]
MIGAGAIGLAIGWRLAEAGCAVELFERGAAGRGASWAAAGMLAAGVETEPGEQPLLALTRPSQALWPVFAQELAAASGLDVGYRDEGTLVVALTRDDAEQLRNLAQFQRGCGIELTWLDGAGAREREPYLTPRVVGAVFSPRDHQVDNRRLVTALIAAATAAGARLYEHTNASVDLAGGRAVGVRCGDRRVPADIVVLAAGAWSRSVDGLPADLALPVRPIKGQMLALRMDPTAPLIRHVVWAPKAYLVPRRDGRLLIGATVEERGFDGANTAGAIYGLLDGAWRAVPALEELAIDEMWAGFRPGSRDDAPILGPSGIDGLVLATGHHRNGILLTPITADGIRDYVLTGALPEVLQPFGLARFTRPRPVAAAAHA